MSVTVEQKPFQREKATWSRAQAYAQLKEWQSRERAQMRRELPAGNNWRFYDHPLRGSIFRTPDDMRLQRGITYTILPDGQSLRVPRMAKVYRDGAAAEGHNEGEGGDIMKALHDMLMGKIKGASGASFDRRGRVRGRRGARIWGKKPAARGDPVRYEMDLGNRFPKDPIGHPDDLPRPVDFE